jgi:hypothetical protein
VERHPVFMDWNGIIEMSIILKVTCRLNIIYLKGHFYRNMKNHPKTHMET